jgi:regulator of sigma E protease
MLTIIAIVLLFASLVLLHEYGHFVVARRNGVKVEEFGFGFPPKLYGRVHKGVLYSFNLLPLGGFVRLKGEDANDMSEGSFAAASLATKAKILMAGVSMNLLTAFIIFYALCVTGLPGLGKQFEPSFLKPTYAQNKQLILSDVEKNSPAAAVGLKRGDYVLAFDGKTISTDVQLHDLTKANAGREASLTVKQGNTVKDIKVTLRPPSANSGFLGVVSQQVYKLRYDPLQAVAAAAYVTLALLVATIVGVFQLFIALPSLIMGLFSASVPAAAAAASGPVGIVFILKSISSLGWAYVFLFMANISVALAAFNALPLPALDGGRLFVSVVQRVTKRTWKPETEAKYHAVGFMALIGLMVLISVYDVRKYF